MYGLGGYCRPRRPPAAGGRPALDATPAHVVRIHSDIWSSIHAYNYRMYIRLFD